MSGCLWATVRLGFFGALLVAALTAFVLTLLDIVDGK